MRNTVYALAPEHLTGSIEAYGLALARHFVDANPSVTHARDPHRGAPVGPPRRPRARVPARVGRQARVRGDLGGRRHARASRTCWCSRRRTPAGRATSTTSTRRCRRPATGSSAPWSRPRGTTPARRDYDAAWEGARDAILRVRRPLLAVGAVHALPAGRGGAGVCDAIARARFSLPNRHHLLYDLARFGIENDREIFHATTEPYGLIEGTVEREPAETGAPLNGRAAVTA